MDERNMKISLVFKVQEDGQEENEVVTIYDIVSAEDNVNLSHIAAMAEQLLRRVANAVEKETYEGD
ncbi:hypothetical protein [Paludifilum halophilum]|uniref:Uncharacterized protein n=1 Tax=Paludifilum halophilum TaxID=1642702 RepID=A0A235B8A5_9BACL|nr:hypothetical protein [Paludifilum halophilum]OYD08524.1 hypothetical protein CHM34_06775 [Paludifilum halophilum]